MFRFLRRNSACRAHQPAKARLGLESLETRAVPATFTVNTLTDDTDGTNALVSMREAIAGVNGAFQPANAINFDAGLRGTITLDAANGALPAINAPVDINGPGADVLTLDVNGIAGADGFRITASEVINISGLSIINAGRDGVRVDVASAVVTVNGVEVDSSAENGVRAAPFSTLTVRNSTLAGNGTSGVTTFALNTTIEQCTISGNFFRGVDATGGPELASPVSVRNSTVVGNSSAGVAIGPGVAVALSSTIVAGNGVAAGDIDTNGGSSQPLATSDRNFIGAGVNLMALSDADANGNRVGTLAAPLDPGLGALLDNGGPTRTHLPNMGSPVLERGNPNGFMSDQRGLPRLVGIAPDVGAVESALPPVGVGASAGSGGGPATGPATGMQPGPGTGTQTGTTMAMGTGAGTNASDSAADADARFALIQENARQFVSYVKTLADLYGSTGWSCLKGAMIVDYDGDGVLDVMLIHPGGYFLVISGDATTGHRILFNNYPGAPRVG